MRGIFTDGTTAGRICVYCISKRKICLYWKLEDQDGVWTDFSTLHRFLAKFMGVPEEDELKYTMVKICDNFSNYSAWHNRRYVIVHGRQF
jgi:geranylgeranyl transferase type-2 subunit alpha